MSEGEVNHSDDHLYAPEGSEDVKTPPKHPIIIKRNLVYAGVFVILVIFGFTYMMAQLINVNSQCTANPFVYGASIIQTSRGDANALCACDIKDDILCTCQMTNQGQFWFDDKQIYEENPLYDRLGISPP